MARARVLTLSVCVVLASTKEIIKGIAWGPVPLKSTGGVMLNDDFMSSDGKPLWGDWNGGRGDLKIIKATGANTVRLYGNDPNVSKTEFLDEVAALGMEAVPGMSDFPFTQMPGNCLKTGGDCYAQVRESYLGNLKNGFLRPDGSYHPAMRIFIVLNEPELKMGTGINDPKGWSKALMSAIDGMLSAEQQMGAKGNLPNFTVTFSYGVCSAPECKTQFEGEGAAGLGQMMAFKLCMMKPSLCGYTQKNDGYTNKLDLPTFFRTRFTFSFNTANPARDMAVWIPKYEILFPSTPVFIGEYHCYFVETTVQKTQQEDLKLMVALAEKSGVFMGFNFFEFQVRYDKGGDEMKFGMFDLKEKLRSFKFFGTDYDVSCVKPVIDPKTKEDLYNALSLAFQGKPPAQTGYGYCGNAMDPAAVALTAEGFLQARDLNTVEAMAVFIRRMVARLGGSVRNEDSLRDFASSFIGASARGFGTLMSFLGELRVIPAADPCFHPCDVADWDLTAGCIADRDDVMADVAAGFGIVFS